MLVLAKRLPRRIHHAYTELAASEFALLPDPGIRTGIDRG